MARFSGSVVFTIALLLQCSQATTHYVGNCKVSKGYFNKIQDAVNVAIAGDTVAVCPGSYVEQVIISTPLTLQGVFSHDSSQILISPPWENLQAITTAVLPTQIIPAVWVTASGGAVNIKNIYVAACSPITGVDTTGFYYASDTSGTLNHILVTDCDIGIWLENTSTDLQGITVENSVTETSIYGIVAASKQPANTIPVLGATISRNQVQGAQYGIYLYQVGGTTSGNSIVASGATYGIWDASPGATVTGNAIIGTGGLARVTGIMIAAANDSVTNNIVTAPQKIGIDFNCLSVTNVTGNTINAQYGIYHVLSTFTGTNTFFNTQVNRSGGC